MSAGERGMGLGLRALGRIAGSESLERLRLRRGAERAIYRASREGFRAAALAGSAFKPARREHPARLRSPEAGSLFDLTPSEEQQLIAETFAEFAARRLRPAASAADSLAAAPPELLAELAELGLATLGVPEELGGAGEERSSVTGVLAAQALAHGDMGLTLAALAPASVATALALWGDGEQQASFLPALLEDNVAAALALSEPRALFDPQRPASRATQAPGGGYLLEASKTLVPRAGDSALLIIGAMLEGHGPALFLVPADTPGVLSRPAAGMGVRAAALGDVLAHEVRLPAGALLGGGDPAVYAECVRRSRLAWSALTLGSAQAVLDYVIPYVNERVAFGEPISHRQAVAFAVADIAVELEGMRLCVLRAAARADAGKDFAQELAAAHSLCVRHGARIGSEGVQLLGGHGYVTEHPVERFYRDLQAVGAIEGGVLV